MKNRKIKTVFLGIAACAAFIAGAALCSVNGVKPTAAWVSEGAGNVQVYAAESESGASANESANAAFRMLGASVRLAEDEKNGIRFVAGATKELYESTLKNGVESGILVLPDDLLGGSELAAETAESLGAQKADISDLWRQDKENENEYIAAAYLYDIPVSSYTRNICARAYYKTSDGEYVYADPVTRSFNYVAQAALNDSEAEWSAEEKALLNGYLVKGYDGEILSFSNEKQASKSWGDPTVSFVSEYKGGNGLMKAELPQKDGFGFGHTTAWQAAFWNNYYSDYNKIAFEFYVENAASLKYCSYVAQNALGSDGLTKNRDISLSGGGFIEGWNRVLVETSAFTAYYTKYCSDPMFWAGTSAAGVTVYFDEIYATHALTVTPAKTFGFTGVEILLSDDSADIFAGCTDLTAEVRGADGVETIENGRFTPAKEGKYTVIYRAKDANGRNATASYVISVVAPEKAGLLYGFDSVAELGNYNKSVLTWAEEYYGETGVVKFVNPKAGTNDPWQTAYMCRGINVLFDKDYYTSHSKLIVRMYSELTDQNLWVMLYSETPWKELAGMQIKTAGWKDYVIDMSKFTDSWDAFVGTFTTSTTAAQYAFAEIRVADVVTVTNSGATTRELGEITLTDNATNVFENCTAVKCEVLAPNGKIVPENGKFTATEQGTYTVRSANRNGGLGGSSLPVRYATEVTTGTEGWATACLSYDAEVPEGTKAYCISAIEGNQVVLNELDEIPAGEGFILNAAEGTHTFAALEAAPSPISNLLVGTLSAVSVEPNSVYVLGKRDGAGEMAMMLYTGTEIGAGHAYLPMPAGEAVAAYTFRLGTTDGITSVEADGDADTTVYNLNGQRVEAMQKGRIYIVNGKKVIVK